MVGVRLEAFVGCFLWFACVDCFSGYLLSRCVLIIACFGYGLCCCECVTWPYGDVTIYGFVLRRGLYWNR